MSNNPLDNLEKAAAEEEREEEIRKEVKELLDEKPKQPAKPGAGSDYGRGQRNVATNPDKTAYDPDFGKPRPDPNKTVYDPDFGKPKSPKHVVEAEKGVKPEAATRQVKPAKSAGPETRKTETTRLVPTKIKPKAGKRVGRGLKASSTLKTLGKIVGIGAVASVIGFAILDHLGVAVFEHAADQVIEKMGPETDLSDYLPGEAKAKKVIWSEASYTRYSREDVGSDSLPNVLVDDITIYPPKDGILVFGISIEGLPDFVGDIDINELGKGNSDWLCEKYQEYLICRSMSKSYPLAAKLESVITMQYHLPAYELKEMLASGGGSRAVYFIVNN